MKTPVDWPELERRHANLVRAGVPVLPWSEFASAAEQMLDSAATIDREMIAADQWLDQQIPPADRYPGWQEFASEEVIAIYSLFDSLRVPNSLSMSDFRFQLSYGKSKRSPLRYMQSRAAEFARYATKVRRAMAKVATGATQ